MKIPSKVAPSRQNKKQVIAFLLPVQINAARALAASSGRTNQEIIAQAINAVYKEYGMAPLVPVDHKRIVRRANKRARIRAGDNGPACRAGRQSMGGWFDISIVDQLNTFSSELSLPMQSIISRGIFLLTGVSHEEGEWLAEYEQKAAASKAKEAAAEE